MGSIWQGNRLARVYDLDKTLKQGYQPILYAKSNDAPLFIVGIMRSLPPRFHPNREVPPLNHVMIHCRPDSFAKLH